MALVVPSASSETAAQSGVEAPGEVEPCGATSPASQPAAPVAAAVPAAAGDRLGLQRAAAGVPPPGVAGLACVPRPAALTQAAAAVYAALERVKRDRDARGVPPVPVAVITDIGKDL